MTAKDERQRKEATRTCGKGSGAPNTNRTCDLPLRRGLLYPLSYRGEASFLLRMVISRLLPALAAFRARLADFTGTSGCAYTSRRMRSLLWLRGHDPVEFASPLRRFHHHHLPSRTVSPCESPTQQILAD